MITFFEYAADIIEFFEQNGMDFKGTVPKIILDDSKNSRFDVFAKTGKYNWSNDTITLVIENRHAKDIMRTLCHELIHAWQFRSNPQLFKMLDKSGNLKDNKQLLKYEAEAYEKGNILFRMYTESKVGRL